MSGPNIDTKTNKQTKTDSHPNSLVQHQGKTDTDTLKKNNTLQHKKCKYLAPPYSH